MTTEHSPLPLLERVDHDGLRSLAAEWDGLIADSVTPGPFLSWPWISSWLDTLGADADLEAHVARDPADGTLLGVAPFFVERRRHAGLTVPVLRIIGSGPAAPDHLDLPVVRGRPEVGAALWAAVQNRRRWDLIDLDGVADEGMLAGLLLRREGDRPRSQPTLTPYLPLDGGRDATLTRISPSLLSNLGRYGRKLDREAPAAVTERMVVERADLEATMDRLAALHSDVRGSRGEKGAFATPALDAFQREVARRMLEAGRLRLWRLDVGTDTIAVIECFRHGDTVAFYTTGYDRQWSRYGPGRRIMFRAVLAAADEDALRFDFLRGDEEYKSTWGAVSRYDLRIRRPAGPRGRILEGARRVISVGRGRRKPRP